MIADDDLDIPMGGCLDQVVLTLADHFDRDPLEWWDRVVGRMIVNDSTDQLLLDLATIDLETSTQVPQVRRAMEIALAEEKEGGSED